MTLPERSISSSDTPAIKADSICRALRQARHEFTVGSVQNAAQLEQACRLLYREYRRRGYCEESRDRLLFTPFMFSPHARTFVLEGFDGVVGTVSVFPDGDLGVPIESLYPDEIEQLRRGGVSFAEVGLLATSNTALLPTRVRRLPVFLLFKIGINYALFAGISHLLITVHPKHRRFYELLGFRQFAQVKEYDFVCGNPALPMVQDLKQEARRAARSLREFFLADPFPSEQFSRSFTVAPDPFTQLFGHAVAARRPAIAQR